MKNQYEGPGCEDDEDDVSNISFEEMNRQIKVWKFLLYSKWTKVLVTWIICIAVMLGVPIILDLTKGLDTTERQDYGTCRIRSDFRVDCLPELETHDEASCASRSSCCWTGLGDEQFCYHQLPTPYGLNITGVFVDKMEGDLEGVALITGEPVTPKFKLSTDRDGHFKMEIGDELSTGLFPSLASDPLTWTLNCNSDTCEGDPFHLDVRLRGVEGESTIVQTYFGPVLYGPDLSEISFYLPSPWIYGKDMESFLWDGSYHESYFNFGEDSQVHLPMVMGMHPTRKWYLLLLQTDRPGIQVISRGRGDKPIITWRIMGGNIKVHLIVANDIQTIIKKLNFHLNDDEEIPLNFDEILVHMGFHLCRKTKNGVSFNYDFTNMLSDGIPFDSDCIDYFAMPTALNISTLFDWSSIANLTYDKDIFFPVQVQAEELPSGLCIIGDTFNCYESHLGNYNVTYPDPFKDNLFEKWITEGLQSIPIDFSGIVLHDIKPTDDRTEACDYDILDYVPRGIDLGRLPCLKNIVTSMVGPMYHSHRVYSEKIVSTLQSLSGQPVRSDVTSISSVLTRAVFTGSQAEASWAAMRRSLREILLLGLAGQPLASMPVCGTKSAVGYSATSLLCLRWLQLAAYMPALHSYYEGSDNQRLMFKLPKTYQRYVRWSLEKRYQLTPYLKTTFNQWKQSGLPLARPLFVQFPDKDYIGTWEQFLLGDSILVAPHLHENSELITVNLPPGSWYILGEGKKVSTSAQGLPVTVSTKLYEIPAYQRGGSVILSYAYVNHSMRATVATPIYNLLVAFECLPGPRQGQQPLSSSCWASGVSALYGSDGNVTMEAKTSRQRGQIKVQSTQGLELEVIESMIIAGLEPFGSSLTVTFPDSTEHVANESTSVEYNWETEIMLIRNLNQPLQSQPWTISWQFN